MVNHMSTRGGERQGAGRKTGSSAFKELTVVKRIPQSLVNTVDNWLNEYKQLLLRPIPVDALLIASGAPLLKIPVAADAVRAGFPSPAAGRCQSILALIWTTSPPRSSRRQERYSSPR